jgi:hypothetical protein
MKHRQNTKEVLESVVRQNHSMAGVVRKMAGGTHSHLSRRIMAFGIDTAHFLGKGSNRGPQHKGPRQRTHEEVFVFRTSGYRQKARILRRLFLASGRRYRCEGEGCSLHDSWFGRPLVLQVNQKNGNRLDDRFENLEFLCPNCYSQTPTYCRSMGKQEPMSALAAN